MIGERRFLGLFSSAAYTESVWHVPVLREKANEVLRSGRLRPPQPRRQGADRHPRDLPARRAVPDPDRRAGDDGDPGDGDPRPPPAAALRPPGHLRPVRRVPGLPAPRPLQHHRSGERIRRSSSESFDGESGRVHRPDERVDPARVHFIVHPTDAAGEIPDVDVSELERRLADATRSWHDDFTAATIAEFGEDVGSRLARTFEASFPEAYKEDFRPPPARWTWPARAAGRVRHATCRCSARSDAARGEAPAQGVPSRRADVPLRGAAGAALHGRRGHRRAARTSSTTSTTRRTSTSSGSATRRGMPDKMREPFQRTPPAPSGAATPRSTASTRWCSGRADLAAGHGAARLRQVPEAGQQPLRAWTTWRRRCSATPRSPGCWCSCSRPLRPRPQRAGGRRRGAYGAGRGDHRPRSSARSTTSPASTRTGSCART